MVRSLVSDGVTIANGGLGRVHGVRDPDLPWEQAASDSRAGGQISELINTPIRQDVPGRRLNAWDLVDSSHAHRSLVVPNHVLHCASSLSTIRLAARDIYVVDGIGVTPDELAGYLERVQTSLASAQLTAEPLASLG